MLQSADKLLGLGLRATDGELGKVADLLFDDAHWAVRYFVVETGGWLSGREVLISPTSVKDVDWDDGRLEVNLTKSQVEQAPDVRTDEPVSRQQEADLAGYYGWPVYWGGPALWGTWAPGGYPVAMPGMTPVAAASMTDSTEPVETDREAPPSEGGYQADPHLRSVREVMGYGIQARDGDIGHVDDFLVDDETWACRYMVVDTGSWWPGKKVLVPPQWVERVSWPQSEVHVDLTRDQVKNAPEWDPRQPVGRDYEERLHDYYGRPRYWQDPNLTQRWGDVDRSVTEEGAAPAAQPSPTTTATEVLDED